MAKYRVKDWDRSTFPALFRCADDASRNAQWWYLRCVGVNLGLLVLGALVGSLNPSDYGHKQMVQGVAATCFFLALGTTILLANRRWDRVWYAGRAVAESVKSLTWKFIAGADPFPIILDSGEVIEQFTNSLRELLQENRHLAAVFSGKEAAGEQVTGHMTNLRGAAIGVLRDAYLAQRINEQQEWYANNAATNSRYQNIWFTLLVLLQAGAGVAAVLLTINPTAPWRATAAFSTLASATVAWGQVKRFQELAQAYGFAAQELSLISARAPHVGTREELARFVNDSETAISREHSTWVARRETK
jgi:hypothetical protein